MENLNIEFQGTHGVKLTIERPAKENVSIVVDKIELKERLQKLKGASNETY